MISLKPTKFKVFVVAVLIFIAFFSYYAFDIIFKPNVKIQCGYSEGKQSEECKKIADENSMKYSEYYASKAVFDGAYKLFAIPTLAPPFAISFLVGVYLWMAAAPILPATIENFGEIFILFSFLLSVAYFYFLASLAESVIKTYKH